MRLSSSLSSRPSTGVSDLRGMRGITSQKPCVVPCLFTTNSGNACVISWLWSWAWSWSRSCWWVSALALHSILGTNFFRERSPEFFADFKTSLFTMFQVMMWQSVYDDVTHSSLALFTLFQVSFPPTRGLFSSPNRSLFLPQHLPFASTVGRSCSDKRSLMCGYPLGLSFIMLIMITQVLSGDSWGSTVARSLFSEQGQYLCVVLLSTWQLAIVNYIFNQNMHI